MKRLVCLLLTLTVLLGGMQLAALAEEERVTITIMRDYIAPPEEDGEILQYMRDKYNVNFEIIYIERGNWNESISTKFAKGEIGDIIDIKGLDLLYTYVEQGLLAELPPEFLKENAPFLYNEYVMEDETHALRYTTIDGKKLWYPQNYRKQLPQHRGLARRLANEAGLRQGAGNTGGNGKKALYAIVEQDPRRKRH